MPARTRTPSNPRRKANEGAPMRGGLVLGWSKDGKTVYCNSEDTHSLIIGATRCGKTRHLILPSIGLNALAGESMVITDPKSELYLYTKPFLERLGYEVIAVDFLHPEKSARYNFLQPVLDAAYVGDTARAVQEAQSIAQLLMPDSTGTTDPIWTQGGRAILTTAILAVCLYFDRPEQQNLANVFEFIARMCAVQEGRKSIPLTAYLNALPPDSPLRSAMAVAQIAPEKTRASFYTTALEALELVRQSPQLHAMTAATEFDHNATGDRKRAVFIILPEGNSTYYPLASLFVFQQYQLLVKRADENGGRLPRRVEFLCDEFGNFVKIPDMDKAITVGGGRGIRFHFAVQDTNQIYERYGERLGKTMTSNCETWLFLYSDNTDTVREIKERLSTYTVKSPSLSSSSGGQSSASYNFTGRDLLGVDEIRRIRRPWQLVMSRNDPAVFYAPDVSQTVFNRLYGMGSFRHNQYLQAYRNSLRPNHTAAVSFWDGYKAYQ